MTDPTRGRTQLVPRVFKVLLIPTNPCVVAFGGRDGAGKCLERDYESVNGPGSSLFVVVLSVVSTRSTASQWLMLI